MHHSHCSFMGYIGFQQSKLRGLHPRLKNSLYTGSNTPGELVSSKDCTVRSPYGCFRYSKALVANMISPLRSLVAMALASIAFIPSASGATLTSTTSSLSTSSGIEVDVIFPIQNATYNDTKSLPVVFALQNLKAASASGLFWFTWGIVPYFGGPSTYNLPEDPHINAYWQARFTTANTTTQPYILVNQTNVLEWQFGAAIPGELYRFELQWAIQWETCNYPPVTGSLIFNVNIGSPEPDLGSIVGTCPQLGGSFQISSNNSCPVVANNTAISNPCAVDLNATTVATISSSVQSLAAASAAAASASAYVSAASSAAASASTSSPAAHNDAFGPNVPMPYVFVAAAVSTLQMMIYL